MDDKLAVEISDNVYWVGAKDWDVRNFHGYKTQKGTSYNAYLIVDEKIVLIDSVKEILKDEMMARISSVLDPSKIDIIVSNHVEMDHSGTIKDVLKYCPDAQVITSVNGEKGLKFYYDTSEWDLKVVKSGESLNIGKRDLTFIHTPMVHWPDNMVTYSDYDKILFSNDAFGQHYASASVFISESDKSIVFDEAAKYYANIVYPYGVQVKKALQACNSLDINIIACSHGVIWNKYIEEILGKYQQWSSYESLNGALIVYDSMWKSTEVIANRIKYTFEEKNIPVVVRNLKFTHISDVMTDVLESKYIALGTPVLNTGILPTMASFISYMEGLAPKNKKSICFGSYGWAQHGYRKIEEVIERLDWQRAEKNMYCQYKPGDVFLNEVKVQINKMVM